MARIGDLPADQQAVLRLLLTQERSYDEIARTLRMAPAAVRDRAHEAVGTLGPSGGTLKPERRDAITDYLLGQQAGDDAEATRTALEASAAERGWARVVAAELKGVATRDLPEVPGPGADAAGASPLLDDEADDELTDGSERAARRSAPRPRASRRGGAILLGALGLIAALAIGFFVGRATKDEPSQGESLTAAQQEAARDVIGQANLTAVPDAGADKALGVAQFVERDGQRLINVLAEGLPTPPKGSGYGVWMTGNGQQPVWLGYFQAVTTNGQAGAQSTLKQNPRLYQQVLITRESGRNPKTPGSSYLTGDIQFRSK